MLQQAKTLGRVTAGRFVLVSLVFFLLTVLEGLIHPTKFLLKDFYSSLLGIDPKFLKTFCGYFITKIHSHIGVVGWVSTAMMGILYFLAEELKGRNRYVPWLCVANLVLQVLGVLVIALGWHLIGVTAVPTGYQPGSPEFRAAAQNFRGMVAAGGLVLLASALVFIYHMAATLLARDQAPESTAAKPGQEAATTHPQKRWQGRVATSLLTMVGLVISGVSGLILYFEPHGRVAYWTHWSFWGLEKTQWDDVHILSSVLFLVAGGFHIYFNWRSLWGYLTKKTAQALRYKKELAVALVAGLWLVVSGISSLPPLSYVTQFSGYLKSAWVTAPELEPPFGHAELLSLKVFCQRMQIPLDQAQAALRAKGIQVKGPRESLEDMARNNGLTPMQVYAYIKPLEPKPEPLAPGAGYTREQVENKFAGSGLGRKKFKFLVQELALDPALARQRLQAHGITIDDDQSVKDAATAAGKTPLDLVVIMLDAK